MHCISLSANRIALSATAAFLLTLAACAPADTSAAPQDPTALTAPTPTQVMVARPPMSVQAGGAITSGPDCMRPAARRPLASISYAVKMGGAPDSDSVIHDTISQGCSALDATASDASVYVRHATARCPLQSDTVVACWSATNMDQGQMSLKVCETSPSGLPRRHAIVAAAFVALVGCGGGSSQPVAVKPAGVRVAKTIAITGGNNQMGAGLLSTSLTALAADSIGEPVSGVTVTFAVTAGGGSVGTPSATTNTSGIASTTWTLGSLGTQTVTATVTGLSGSPLTFGATVNAGLPEPAFNSATQTMVYQDNMDEYTDVSLMGAQGQSQPLITPHPAPITNSTPVLLTQNAIISPGRGGTGSALRMLFTGVSQTEANFMTWNMPATPPLATHYFQYWARVNFATPLGTSIMAVKWFEVWHHVDRVQWNTHSANPGPAGKATTFWQVYDQSRLTTGQADQPVGPYLANLFDNQWHRFTYAYRVNTSSGSRDGFAQMWIDGSMVINISAAAIGVTPPTGDRPWCAGDDVDALAVNDGLGLAANPTAVFGNVQTTTTPPWTYDIDDYKWWYTP